MPTYQYECSQCGHEFEQFQRMSEDPTKRCPKCKKLKLRRLLGTGAGIIFKGSGFYETDYKKKSAPPAESGAKPAAKAEPVASAPSTPAAKASGKSS